MTASHDDPRRMQPDHAPTPFSAAEIRDGCPAGRTLRLLVESPDGRSLIRVTRFATSDAEGAETETRMFTLDGESIGEPERARSTWREFQAHASFPAALTEIADEEIEVPAGRYDCVRYTVTREDRVDGFWFAGELPGMPVKMVSRSSGGSSVISLVANEPGGANDSA